MKLIIQLPCYNEEKTLPVTLEHLPKKLPGIDVIEFLVIDDGSTDRTREVAAELGVHHIVGFRKNRGLARTYALGVSACLDRGADIIVNTDADNQYPGEDIVKLVQPILDGQADIVVGDRQTQKIEHFSPLKKTLQKYGSRVVSIMACTEVPDATSGFRALSREAALDLTVVSNFSYTLETLIQAGRKKMAILSVPIETNEQLRESRLFKSTLTFLKRSAATMVRVYAAHEPLKMCLSGAFALAFIAAIIFVRFLILFCMGEGGGHIQSLILGAVLVLVSVFLTTLGILADMIAANRRMIEELLHRSRDQ